MLSKITSYKSLSLSGALIFVLLVNMASYFFHKDFAALLVVFTASILSLISFSFVIFSLNLTKKNHEVLKAFDKINALTCFDPLTSLSNKQYFLTRLKTDMQSTRSTGTVGALILIDFDHFKTINDSIGHPYGDLLIKTAADRLVAIARDSRFVARVGGDEFMLVMQDIGTTREEAIYKLELMLHLITSSLLKSYYLDDRSHYITSSIGVTMFDHTTDSVDAIVRESEIAMYEAKRLGRNQYVLFEDFMQVSLTSRAELERDLYTALPNNNFKVFFQVQVDSFGAIVGVEALLRWVHPVHGFINPSKFIYIAEETGIINSVGHWVIEMSCAQLRKWQKDEKTRHLTISVNVSAKQFLNPMFCHKLRESIAKFNINPKLLKLELTETLFVNDINVVVHTMKDIKSLGIGISLDDFGTGYSSLQYLKSMPIDEIKLDQSFVRDIYENKNSGIIIRSLIDMSIALDIDVFVEGVETTKEFEFLQDIGCQYFQGFLFGKPMPISDLEQFILHAREQTRNNDVLAMQSL